MTICTAGRKRGLTEASLRAAILRAVKDSDGGGDTDSWAFTVMPNHVHWLFVLGDRLRLGRVVARLKARNKAALAAAGLGWQRDFFDHRLRPEERPEAYARYIFLNPYRAGLLPPEASWLGWWCPEPRRVEFLALLNPDGSVPREWLESDDNSLDGWPAAGGD